MSHEELPNWVWDLLADLVDEDAVHPPLFTAAGSPYDWCPLIALDNIPNDMLRIAEHIATLAAPLLVLRELTKPPRHNLPTARAGDLLSSSAWNDLIERVNLLSQQ